VGGDSYMHLIHRLLGNFHAVRIDKERSAGENHFRFASIERFCIIVLHGDYDLRMFVEESILIGTMHQNSLDRWVVVANFIPSYNRIRLGGVRSE
jgi:hypothetical protein